MTAERISKRDLLAAKICSLTDHEVVEVLEYLNIMETMRSQTDTPAQFEEEVMEMIAPDPLAATIDELPGARRIRRRVHRIASSNWTHNFTC